MFIGEHRPLVDDRGRVAVPSRLRKAFGDELIDKLVLAPGFDRCVMAYRSCDWEKFVEEKLLVLPQNDPANRKKIRFLLGGATECELDGQGRILIPQKLKSYASIEKETVMIGVYDRIEIWDACRYDDYTPADDVIDTFAAELGI